MIAQYEKTIYQSEKNGFCIMSMTSEDEDIPKEARSSYYNDGKIHFSVTGYYLPATKNVVLDLVGKWQRSKYGLQFVVDSYTEIIPKTDDGVIAYLSSGLFKGIGKATAEAIVNLFGHDTLNIIESQPKRLLEVKGISEKKLLDFTQAYEQSKGLRDILSFLGPYGVTVGKAKKIQEHFGSRSLDVIQNSPFLLCEISGFGFKTVDEIARKVNFKPADLLRIEGGIRYILEEASENGHLYLPKADLQKQAFILLSERVPENTFTEEIIRETYSEMCSWGKLAEDNGKVYLPDTLYQEEDTARVIAKMLKRKPTDFPDLDNYISSVQKNEEIKLSERQINAVKMCMKNPLSIITGGPGTGKTTVLKVILSVYQSLFPGKEILLAAPTGRAASKMAESTGYPNASTLHSALGIDGEIDEYEKSTVLSADFVIVDEASMVDMKLAYRLFNSIGSTTKVLLVGDVDQLPSVGAGNVLHEIISSNYVPVTVLDMVFRQKVTSRIAMNAYNIKQGNANLLYGNDFGFIPAEDTATAANIIEQEYQKNVQQYGLERVQVLTPFRMKTETGSMQLNKTLRDLVNPCRDKRLEVQQGSRSFRYNDKVMQTKNLNEISNGDIGFVTAIDKGENETVTVTFSENRMKRYADDELNCVDLAYAITIHKSQGTEYDCVIIPVLSAFYVMLRRALIYTAITRAKKKVIIVGQKKALFMAIHKNDNLKRNTALAERICCEYEKEVKNDVQKRRISRKSKEYEQLTL